jgi:DNA topoisomerase-1
LGEHPDRGGAVAIMDGKYGPYVKWEKVNATLPDNTEPDNVTMELAVQLIEEREAKAGKKKTTRKKKAS